MSPASKEHISQIILSGSSFSVLNRTRLEQIS
jgi:hypothetical protein